jgi:lipid-binding SYLF domain-containing protein
MKLKKIKTDLLTYKMISMKHAFLKAASIFFLFSFVLGNSPASAQLSSKDRKVVSDARIAKDEFIRVDGLMKNLFKSAYAYAIFPNVGKGGLGIGGATGNGAVYQNGELIGMARMTQLTIGFQWGGQAYREVIFFENSDALDRFKESRFELSAQASAVAATAGAAANVKYADGVLIFSQIKGGLMYEASVGGQKFDFRNL